MQRSPSYIRSLFVTIILKTRQHEVRRACIMRARHVLMAGYGWLRLIVLGGMLRVDLDARAALV